MDALFAPEPCGTAQQSDSPIDRMMAPVSPAYSAFLIALNGDACLQLGANANIRPPAVEELLQNESQQALFGAETVMNLPDDEPGSFTVVRSGQPSDLLVRAAEVDPTGVYAVVIRSSATDRPENVIEVAKAVGEALLLP
jgi:hypothetical protein